MNNQIPNFYLENNSYPFGFIEPKGYQSMNQAGNFNEIMFERINNHLNRLERQIKILENKLNSLEDKKINQLPDIENDSMYMI